MGLLRWLKRKSAIREFDRLLREHFRGAQTKSGVSINAESALQCATVFACVRVRSEDIAKLPLILYKRTSEGKERAVDHPLYRVVRWKFNVFQTAYNAKQMLVSALDLRGDFFAYIIRAGARVTDIIPIPPDCVEITQKPDYSVVYTVRTRDKDGKETKKDHSADEILHVKALTLDGIKGVTPIKYQRETIGLSLAAQQHAAVSFKNGARASLVLKFNDILTPDDRKRLEEKYREALTGENVNQLLVIDEGMEFKDVNSLTAEDMQYIEGQKFNRNEICGIFRVPPHKIADLERATFSNIEHSSLEYVADCLMSTATAIEQAFTTQLLTADEQKEYFFEFLYDALLKGDLLSRMQAHQLAIMNGILCPDEAREIENRNKRPDGKGGTYYSPSNLLPAGTTLKVTGREPEDSSNSNGGKKELRLVS